MAKKGLGRGLDILIPKAPAKEQAVPEVENTMAADAVKEITPEEPFEIQIPEVLQEFAEEAAEQKASEKQASKLRQSQLPASIEKEGESIVTLKISKVEPNKEQSRKTFDETALNELAESIKQYGVIQPIVVCRKGDFYEIIAGERRWRAAKKAGLTEVPVVIRDYEEKERAAVSLIENIQRENLNPIEEAAAYKQLIDEFHLTQENLAAQVSKSRTAIANTMRLLKLTDTVQKLVVDGKLTGGHARALIAIEDPQEQIKAANKIIANNLNVRQTEELVKSLNEPEPAPTKKKKSEKEKQNDKFYKDLEGRMTEVLGTKVRILKKEKGAGKIEINYFSESELDRIYTCINSLQV